ncbi:MAG: hypothetical protein ABW033_06030 [Acidimicrobiia bacterium]
MRAADDTSLLARWSGWIVATAAVVASSLIFHAARGTSFFLDEWWFITERRDASLDDFLRPHFGHLIAIPVAIYKVLFATFGLRSYQPYLIVLVAIHVLTCALLYVYLRRRGPVLYALVATILMLFLGHAWEDLIWPFNITYLLSAATGVAALLLLDRRDRLGDVAATAALAVSISSSGMGLVFAGGVLVELLWTRRDWRRLWIVAAPAAAYALWYVNYEVPQGSLDNLTKFDPFTTRLAGETSRSLLGTSVGLGQIVVVLFVAAVGVQVVRTWPISGRVANSIAMLGGYWVLLTYTRGGDQFFGRYTYLSALLVLLVVGELVTTWRPIAVRSRAVTLVGGAALLLLLGYSLVNSGEALANGGAERRAAAIKQHAAFSSLVLAKDRATSETPIWWLFPDGPNAAGVIDAVADLDFPVFSSAELLQQPEVARRAADEQLFAVLGGLDLFSRDLASDGLRGLAPVGGTLTSGGACVTFTPNAPDAHLDLTGDEIGVRIEAIGSDPVDVGARSISDGYRGQPSFSVQPGIPRDLALRANGLKPWTLRLRSSDALRACAVHGS